MLATAAGDIAVVLGALGIFIAAVATSIVTVFGQRTLSRGQKAIADVVTDTHAQVVTLNESTIGELAAADETRRAQRIAHDDRTEMEQRHIDTAPHLGPAQGPTPGSPRLADHVEAIHQAVEVEGEVSLFQLMHELDRKIDALAVAVDARGSRIAQLEQLLGLPEV